MTDREKLIEIVERAAHRCLPSNTEDFHLSMFVTDLLAHGVVVREKGEWEIREDSYGNELMWCPFCHEEFYDGDNDTIDHTPNFCPNCGADMRKGENG